MKAQTRDQRDKIKLEVICAEPGQNRKDTPLLFIHGAFHSAWCWEENFIPYFKEKGYLSYALSLRGHGHSSGYENLDSYTLTDYVDDVLQVLAELPVKEKPVLIGHSVGGAVVQEILAAHPGKVKAAILMAPVPYDGSVNFSSFFRLLFHGFKEMWQLMLFDKGKKKSPSRPVDFPYACLFAGQLPEEKKKSYASRLQRESEKVSRQLARRFIARPGDVKDPLLIVGAMEDFFFTPRDLLGTAKAYGSQAIFLPHSGHDIMLDTGWELAACYIENFLSQHVD
jgi:pimeloyl-ACP methyl ester carboxylesterase